MPAIQQQNSVFGNMADFENAQRMCMALAKSNIIPKNYQGVENVANIMVALEMANRMGASPIMIMQNLHIIQGRPSFGSAFLISTVNSCGRFSPINYKIKSLGPKKIKVSVWVGESPNKRKEERVVDIQDMECIAVATELRTGETLEGPRVTIEMAVLEGWYTKNDSKWITMPDLMIRYRAAAFFVRTFAPELSMGMKTAEEIQDVDYLDITPTVTKQAAAQKLNKKTPPPDFEPETIIPENDNMPDGSDSDQDNNANEDDLI